MIPTVLYCTIHLIVPHREQDDVQTIINMLTRYSTGPKQTLLRRKVRFSTSEMKYDFNMASRQFRIRLYEEYIPM